jgi:hypothetical protein
VIFSPGTVFGLTQITCAQHLLDEVEFETYQRREHLAQAMTDAILERVGYDTKVLQARKARKKGLDERKLTAKIKQALEKRGYPCIVSAASNPVSFLTPSVNRVCVCESARARTRCAVIVATPLSM